MLAVVSPLQVLIGHFWPQLATLHMEYISLDSSDNLISIFQIHMNTLTEFKLTQICLKGEFEWDDIGQTANRSNRMAFRSKGYRLELCVY